jgi:hypothetical protein
MVALQRAAIRLKIRARSREVIEAETHVGEALRARDPW